MACTRMDLNDSTEWVLPRDKQISLNKKKRWRWIICIKMDGRRYLH